MLVGDMTSSTMFVGLVEMWIWVLLGRILRY
jgi:hypothetical protein